jgi:plastocyanin
MAPNTLFPCVESATQVLLRCRRFVLMALLVLASHSAAAAALEILIRDRSGAPFREAIVTISDGNAVASREQDAVAMDQVDMRFVPQLLLVSQRGSVRFPNSDNISHQVYSFSAAKRFQLPLYKGDVHAPVVFDKPGLVVVGCNIHDHMVGYIYVTDARWHGMTDAAGRLTVSDVPAGEVKVTIWNPRIADAPKELTRAIDIPPDGDVKVEFRLTRALRDEPEPRPRNPDWDY